MGSPLLITLNPGVGREEGSAPLAGVLVDLPCDEERAGSVPPVLAVCPHPQQSLAPGTSLLLQTLLIFLRGFMERETPIKVALGTLQVLPGLDKSKVFPRPPQHLIARCQGRGAPMGSRWHRYWENENPRSKFAVCQG